MQSASGRAGLVVMALLIPVAAGLGFWAARRTPPPATSKQAETVQLWTCGMHPQVLQDKPGTCPICHMALTPVEASGRSVAESPGHAHAIYIDPVVVQNMGLRVAPVTSGGVISRIGTVGYLRLDESRIHDVSLKIGGWIDRLYADTEGLRVTRGDVLFDLYSPDLAVAVEEYRNAVASSREAPSRLRNTSDAVRATADSAGHTTSPHGFQSLADAARARLLRWDVSPFDATAALSRGGPRITVPFRSPVDGHILEKKVVEGAAVEPGMVLFRIADLSTLWLDARVYESEIGAIRIGQAVRATIAAAPNAVQTGKVIFINPVLDSESRSTTVRMEFPNGDFQLRPGMFARVEFDVAATPGAVLSVPREAIIDTGRRQIAFVTRGEGHFEPREVQMGTVGDDGMAEVLAGLAPTDTVVVSGQFLLDSESRTQEAIQKMLDSKLLEAPHGSHR
jgi:Cu(I)/Ag(I) efflux system membrane fusion protein